MVPKLQCAKCKTTDAMEFTPIEYPEDDGTTTTHYGCDRCIEDMGNFVDARREHLVNHGDHRHTV